MAQNLAVLRAVYAILAQCEGVKGNLSSVSPMFYHGHHILEIAGAIRK